jgi:hypothetical protein
MGTQCLQNSDQRRRKGTTWRTSLPRGVPVVVVGRIMQRATWHGRATPHSPPDATSTLNLRLLVRATTLSLDFNWRCRNTVERTMDSLLTTIEKVQPIMLQFLEGRGDDVMETLEMIISNACPHHPIRMDEGWCRLEMNNHICLKMVLRSSQYVNSAILPTSPSHPPCVRTWYETLTFGKGIDASLSPTPGNACFCYIHAHLCSALLSESLWSPTFIYPFSSWRHPPNWILSPKLWTRD